jgi:hypothetical protein
LCPRLSFKCASLSALTLLQWLIRTLRFALLRPSIAKARPSICKVRSCHCQCRASNVDLGRCIMHSCTASPTLPWTHIIVYARLSAAPTSRCHRVPLTMARIAEGDGGQALDSRVHTPITRTGMQRRSRRLRSGPGVDLAVSAGIRQPGSVTGAGELPLNAIKHGRGIARRHNFRGTHVHPPSSRCPVPTRLLNNLCAVSMQPNLHLTPGSEDETLDARRRRGEVACAECQRSGAQSSVYHFAGLFECPGSKSSVLGRCRANHVWSVLAVWDLSPPLCS